MLRKKLLLMKELSSKCFEIAEGRFAMNHKTDINNLSNIYTYLLELNRDFIITDFFSRAIVIIGSWLYNLITFLKERQITKIFFVFFFFLQLTHSVFSYWFIYFLLFFCNGIQNCSNSYLFYWRFNIM